MGLKLNRRSHWFPLFRRELIELAGRRQTYLFRVAYAALFFTIVLWQQGGMLAARRSMTGIEVLGSGGPLFNAIVGWQYAGILLVMPIITAGAIAGERERDTLALLLCTHLKPTEIILQKLASRMLIMLSLIGMSIPLMAFAYSLGGIDTGELAASIVVLLIVALVIGSYSMYWSARSATTGAALIGTIVTGPLILWFIGCCCGGLFFNSGMGVSAGDFLGYVLVAVLFGGAIAAFFLILAADVMVTRLDMPARSFLSVVFGGMDKFFFDVNRSWGDVILIRESRTLPDRGPIAWLSMRGRTLSTLRHQVRIVLLMEIVAIFPMMAIISSGRGFSRHDHSGGVLMFLEMVVLVLVTTSAAGLIPTLRGRQTLTILMTIPQSGRDIMLQWMASLRRLILLTLIPISTILLARMYVHYWSLDSILNAVGWLVGIAIMFPLAAWIALTIGLYSSSQLKAIIVANVVIVGWALTPKFLGLTIGVPEAMAASSILFPAQTFAVLEVAPGSGLWIIGLFSAAIMLAIVRTWCLSRADRLLGRCGK